MCVRNYGFRTAFLCAYYNNNNNNIFLREREGQDKKKKKSRIISYLSSFYRYERAGLPAADRPKTRGDTDGYARTKESLKTAKTSRKINFDF